MSAELTEHQALLVLNALPNIGPVTLHRLLEKYSGDPRRVLGASRSELEQVQGVGPAISGTVSAWAEHFNLAREEDRMRRAGVSFLVRDDVAYPSLLREIHDPPIGLYRRGSCAFGQPTVAIVGSRRTTLYGQTVARSLASELARLGFCIVSGLARGIDTAAHEGALEAGGSTAAVLGTGIDIIYPPENLALYRRIEESGAILSEFPFGRRADRQSFAMRNRIVAGMSEAVIVVESDVSGGAMITARFAGEQGRPLFAVPGRIDQATSAGCHQLIRDGATLLTGVEDLLSELNYLGGLRPAPIPEKASASGPAGTMGLNEDEKAMLACFEGGEILGADVIGERTGRTAAQVSAALVMLELKGAVGRRADGTYEARS
jgi:DNA processing protein